MVPTVGYEHSNHDTVCLARTWSKEDTIDVELGGASSLVLDAAGTSM